MVQFDQAFFTDFRHTQAKFTQNSKCSEFLLISHRKHQFYRRNVRIFLQTDGFSPPNLPEESCNVLDKTSVKQSLN